MSRSKIQDMNVHHRNLDVMMKYKDGFAPTWEAYVRWPGYKNRKYFTSITAWNRLPSQAINTVFEKIDAQLGLAWVSVSTLSSGEHKYMVRHVTNEGNYIFTERSLDYNLLRWNNKEHRVESLNNDNTWDVFISDEEITQVDFWDKG